MRLIDTVAVTALAGALVAGPSFAQDIDPDFVAEPYGQAEDWGVYTNPIFADGCFAQAYFDRGTEIRMGVDNRTGDSYLAAFNDAWATRMDDGERVNVIYDIGGTTYETEGAELEEYGREGVAAFFSGDQILRDLTTRGVLTVVVDGEPLTAVELAQTADAVDMVYDCQAQTAD